MPKETVKSVRSEAQLNLAAASAEINRLIGQIGDQQVKLNKECDAKRALEGEIKAVRSQFNDLKERLSNSEMENQRLCGYIQRVQEDDVVREPLVLTGDPNGEQRHVPKRKSKVFESPYNYRQSPFESRFPFIGHEDPEERRPKHWVTY